MLIASDINKGESRHMALCSYSSKLILDNYTVIDNAFLNEFLPQATGDDVKVYLYGLNLCANPCTDDNNLDTICKVLSLTEEQVQKAFDYWQSMGLVQVVSANPYEVRYLPVRASSGGLKIRNKEKYTDFNAQIQEIISGRMITPTEFNEYYHLIESYHFEPEAVILIAKYCTSIKHNAIGYPYILAVARDFEKQGLKTFTAVENKFIEQEKSTAEIKQILTALGLKREADIEERNLYLKWTNHFGFTHGVIVEVAKSLKKRGGFSKLDELLSKYFEQKLFTMEEVMSFSEQRDTMFELARVVSKTLGLYYQNLENVVDTYIADWTNKGYDFETLVFISNYCFKQSIRTLDGMNTIVQKFFKLGLVSLAAIEQYIFAILKADELIKEVLEKTGLVRSVSSLDREFYKTWTNNWGYSHEQILIASESARDKSNPMAYLNRVIATLNEEKITETSAIKNHIKSIKPDGRKASKQKENFEARTYSKEELNAVFDSLDDVEIN